MNVLTSSAIVLLQSCQVGFVSQLQAMVTCSLDGEINICDVHTNQRGSELLQSRFLQFSLRYFVPRFFMPLVVSQKSFRQMFHVLGAKKAEMLSAFTKKAC